MSGAACGSSKQQNMEPFSLYVHIPYCIRKCPYCAFNSAALGPPPEEQYVEALLNELRRHGAQPSWNGRKISSLYFGGGTPSTFSPGLLLQVLDAADKVFGIAAGAEITVEANPGTISGEGLEALRRGGINRLSLGAQSFHSGLLRALGRIHSADETRKAISLSRAAGFDNLSLDLMYAVPTETLDDLEQDLLEICAHAPEHVSAYCLTIEAGTPFEAKAAAGELLLPDENAALAMMELVQTLLPQKGYEHYEISNYSLPGFHSRHNSSYWNGTDYLGIGAGAHSFSRSAQPGCWGVRWANIENPEAYMKCAAAAQDSAAEQEVLTASQAMCEFFFLGLRRMDGVDLQQFEERFGIAAANVYPGVIERLTADGLLNSEGRRVRLSARGFFVADSVAANFASPEEARLSNYTSVGK